jgi:hypothetical protein
MPKNVIHGLIGAVAFLAVLGVDRYRFNRMAAASRQLNGAAQPEKVRIRASTVPAEGGVVNVVAVRLPSPSTSI